MDLLIAQFNSGPLSLEDVRAVLGADFSTWSALSKKFVKTSDGRYFNERLAAEMIKREEFRKKQKERVVKRWEKYRGSSGGMPSGNTTVLPIENENGNIREVGNGNYFILIVPEYANAVKWKIKGEDGLREFFQMHKSILSPDSLAKKFLFENNGKPYNDFKHLFNDYKRFANSKFGG